MAIQTVYTKNGFSFDCADSITPAFQAAYDYVAAHYPVLIYPIEYGVKQSTSDAYAGKTTPTEIEGAGRKKFDAIMSGTVRVAGVGERTPTKTPMEREVWKIAAQALANIFAKKKTPKDRQAVYIRLKVERDWDELAEQAKLNLANDEAIKPDAFAALDELYASIEPDEDEDEDDIDPADEAH